MVKILILGGGFAAIAAAEEIARKNDGSIEISLISKDKRVFFYPALVPYVFGSFERTDLKADLSSVLAENNIHHHIGEVSEVDTKAKTVTYQGPGGIEVVSFDLLLVAMGRHLVADTVPGFSEHADHLLDLEAADRFRARIENFRNGSIVVGLCLGSDLPIPVCEAALSFATRFSSEVAKGEVSVTAVFPETLDDAFYGAALFRDLTSEFERKGISVRDHFRIEKVGPGRVYSDNGQDLPFELLMLNPPFKGQQSVAGLDRFTDAAGFINVDKNLSVTGAGGTYAAGDIISIPGPRFGYMAIRQGKIAGRNLVLEALGQAPSEVYEHSIAWAIGEKYTDPVFFHYGFWDESLDDHDENALFGLVKPIRSKYGPIKGFGKPLGAS